MQSKLDFLLSGPLAILTPSITNTSALHISSLQIDQNINPKFWLTESTGVTILLATKIFLTVTKSFPSSIRHEDDGAYIVSNSLGNKIICPFLLIDSLQNQDSIIGKATQPEPRTVALMWVCNSITRTKEIYREGD